MPGLNGRELARHLVRKRRELRVLFVSGYSKDALSNRSASDPEMVLLSKPFSVAALRTRIREMLDAPGRLAPASNASVAAAQL